MIKETLPLVVCDVDNTVNNLTEALVQRFNFDFGTDYRIEDINQYSISKCLNFKDDSLHFLYLHNPMFWSLIKPLTVDMSANSFITKLNKISNLMFASACTPDMAMYKRDFMRLNFSDVLETSICYVHNKTILKCDILIDDCFDNFRGSNYNKGLLFTQPWNANITIPKDSNIVRVNTFTEILKHVEKYRKETCDNVV